MGLESEAAPGRFESGGRLLPDIRARRRQLDQVLFSLANMSAHAIPSAAMTPVSTKFAG